MRSVSGGDVHQVEYMIDFDSFEAQGKFSDAIVDGEWWTGMMQRPPQPPTPISAMPGRA